MAFMQTLFSSAFTNLFNALVYFAIAALFIVGIARCILPVVRTRNLLRRAIRSIRSGDDKYGWQEDKFLGKGALFGPWSEYLNNLFFADGVYHNASNVEDYINEDTVIYGPGRISFSDALPGLMTSLGFLGTLMGLAQGLSGFNMADSAAVQQSIVTLIPGMRYAFTTSIVGVIGSVLFTLITRAVHGSTEHTLVTFYSVMRRHAGVRSVDPMTQIAIYQQEQTALIQTMAKDLNGAFTENITKAIQDATTPLNDTMRGFVNVTTKDQARFLDAVLQRFTERMNESLEGQLRHFAEVLEETARSQSESMTVVRASMTGINDILTDLKQVQATSRQLLNSVSGYMEQLNASAKQVDDVYTRTSSAVEHMELVSRQQNGYLKSVSAMQTEVTRSMDAMQKTMEGYVQRMGEYTATAAQAMQKAGDGLKSAAREVGGMQASASKQLRDDLSATMESYRDYVNQFTQRVDYLSSSISNSLKKLPDSVNETSDRFLDQLDQLTVTMTEAQRALETAVNRLYRR